MQSWALCLALVLVLVSTICSSQATVLHNLPDTRSYFVAGEHFSAVRDFEDPDYDPFNCTCAHNPSDDRTYLSGMVLLVFFSSPNFFSPFSKLFFLQVYSFPLFLFSSMFQDTSQLTLSSQLF